MSTKTIDRKCHWLRKNRLSRRPELLVFVDTETNEDAIHKDVQLHTLKTGWACLTRYVENDGLSVIGWHKIDDAVEFWHAISAVAVNYKRTYVISHNIDFDARVLRAFSILPGIGWTPDYAIMADTCRFFTFKADKNVIALLDNLNFFRDTLQELGAEFGIEKLAIDLETASERELSVYCKRDVEILVHVWDYWLKFLDKHDLGDFSITAVSQAMNAYRHRWMPEKIGIHNRVDAIRLERESYKGGRCEVFKVGTFTGETFYKLDVNGLYAYCMREYPTPRKLVKVLVDVSPDYMRKLISEYQVIADVIVETDEPYYAYHLRGYNVFPVGTFRVTLTTHEILHALENDHLRAIGEVAIYTPSLLFKNFIDYFTPLRQRYKAAGDTARSEMCKLIRNGLYGKFAQRGYKQSIIGTAPPDAVHVRHWLDLESENECWDWTFGGVVIRQEKSGEGKDSFPGIASHIAAAGRCVLYDYMQKAGKENIYYADTDSLIVNENGYERLTPWIDPIELGCLKIEQVANYLEIHAKKSYVLGDKRVAKGIRDNATLTNEGLWNQTHFTSLKWAFKRGNLDDVITYDVEKHVQDTVTCGTIDRHGDVHAPALAVKQEDVMHSIEPVSPYSWTWWIDVPWLQSLRSRKRTWFSLFERWLFWSDFEEPPPDELASL